jgi:hypothetical protein
MSFRYQNIEGVDGGLVEYNEEEEDQADALNAETFGDDAILGDNASTSEMGFFDMPAVPKQPQGKPISLSELFGRKKTQPQSSPPIGPPPGLGGEGVRLPPPPPPPPPTMRVSLNSEIPPPTMKISLSREMAPPLSMPPPPPPPPLKLDINNMVAPSSRSITLDSLVIPPPPPPPVESHLPQMSIHVVPVRVFPTPFTIRQRDQALNGQLDINKWGKQEEFLRSHSLMTQRDKEFVTKIQLNQMVALSGSSSQNFRGQFTFGRSSSGAAVGTQEEGSLLGKKLYASVYHPRKLVSVGNGVHSNSAVSDRKAKEVAEDCFDILLDVVDVDEYISTLHPLAEQKINEAIIERTELIEKVTNLLLSVTGTSSIPKLNAARKRTIDLLVELVQPPTDSVSEAQARRSLIFRRVPESVQGFYIDLLEKIVQ